MMVSRFEEPPVVAERIGNHLIIHVRFWLDGTHVATRKCTNDYFTISQIQAVKEKHLTPLQISSLDKKVQITRSRANENRIVMVRFKTDPDSLFTNTAEKIIGGPVCPQGQPYGN